MSAFDRWLTTDTRGEALEAEAEALDEAWSLFAQDEQVPYEACEPGHEDHAIYVAWFALVSLVEARENRLAADAEAAAYGPQDGCDRCPCGCKYWTIDGRCIDCGDRWDGSDHNAQ